MKTIITTCLLQLFICSSYGQVSSNKIFESFKQGDRTNCASIALIKASLNVYGLDSLFISQKVTDSLYKITLKNGDSFNLTSEELNKADFSADFVLIKDNDDSKEIRDYSILAYAVMAKYKQIIEKYATFELALEDLEYGAYTPTVYKYLGFEKGKQIQKLRRLKGDEYCGVVAWSSVHAVFTCEGYMDYHGDKRALWFKYSGRFRVIKWS
jgi:hypothetical protein